MRPGFRLTRRVVTTAPATHAAAAHRNAAELGSPGTGYSAGGTGPAILNAANEVAVAAFLRGRTGFTQIPQIVEQTLAQLPSQPVSNLEQLLEVDLEARVLAEQSLS